MTIYRLTKEQQSRFGAEPEIYAAVQVGVIEHETHSEVCLVVGCQVALVFDDKLDADLRDFWDSTWGALQPGISTQARRLTVISLYDKWLNPPSPLRAAKLNPLDVDRSSIALAMILTGKPIPPAPPTRPGLRPRTTTTPPPAYGHLPFSVVTRHRETFYRYEPWPTSLKINRVSGSYDKDTFANPSSELRMNPTGFAAVARNALPSLFPAVFVWKLEPDPVRVACGAVVPMFGQAGGGVEVCFVSGGRNSKPIAKPKVIEPL